MAAPRRLLTPLPAITAPAFVRGLAIFIAALLLPQGDDLDARLAAALAPLAADRERRLEMANAARALARADAAERVAHVVMQEARLKEAMDDDR